MTVDFKSVVKSLKFFNELYVEQRRPPYTLSAICGLLQLARLVQSLRGFLALLSQTCQGLSLGFSVPSRCTVTEFGLRAQHNWRSAFADKWLIMGRSHVKNMWLYMEIREVWFFPSGPHRSQENSFGTIILKGTTKGPTPRKWKPAICFGK